MGAVQTFTRGQTVKFVTNFYDPEGVITQPDAAQVLVTYPLPANAGSNTVTIGMTAPTVDETRWSAQWDSRGAGPGIVFWSVHSLNNVMPPAAVNDGQFMLKANAANPPTF